MNLLVSAGRVLTGPAGEWIDNGAALVEGDVITATGPREEVASHTPADALGLAVPGGIGLPELINRHVRLVVDAGIDPAGSLRASGDVELLLDVVATVVSGRGRRR
ncbi:hypothetical protein [Streptosporangium sp. NPDC000396]|uniref:hypothetical protein n=1 Tax=Streptosporangium sp. NPDC000396 TaxID=3366185 RepID=UPI00367C6576